MINDLDYEKIRGYAIIIIASDSAPNSERKSSSLSLPISILDVNDNYPELKFETENQKSFDLKPGVESSLPDEETTADDCIKNLLS